MQKASKGSVVCNGPSCSHRTPRSRCWWKDVGGKWTKIKGLREDSQRESATQLLTMCMILVVSVFTLPDGPHASAGVHPRDEKDCEDDKLCWCRIKDRS